MLIILDKNTKLVKENMGTNSLFPDGRVPIDEKDDEIYVRINDNSEFALQISSAHDYELVLDDDNEVTSVIVHKSLEQYQAEIRVEQEWLEALQPSEEEIHKAEIELVSTNLLIELGVI